MSDEKIRKLREKIDQINLDILRLLNVRAELVAEIGQIKSKKGMQTFDPLRESEMLERVLSHNKGPFPDEVLARLFKEIFKASLFLIDLESRQELLVSRKHKKEDTIVKVGKDLFIGQGPPVIMAGPCSVESAEQMERIASALKEIGVRIMRGGAFKPRTSPYSFQGLKQKGLEIFRQVADRHGIYIITEVLDTRDVEAVHEYADILQIGARNMYNYELLKEVGRRKKPVMLKRSFMATLEEYLFSAEYIMSQGNDQIVLCERGIRSFEKWTRNTLDISAIPILKRESHLPIIVDISHSTGRRDIALPVAKAALAAGADGIMVEVHYNPDIALSDGEQQLSLDQFRELIIGLNLASYAPQA